MQFMWCSHVILDRMIKHLDTSGFGTVAAKNMNLTFRSVRENTFEMSLEPSDVSAASVLDCQIKHVSFNS